MHVGHRAYEYMHAFVLETVCSWSSIQSQQFFFIADIDSNGYLDERDFACLALRATIVEGKGEFSFSRLQEYQHIMLSLWEEMAELADFNKVF